ncbi:hypothetical protein LCGC14_0478050 [marine sediment metagenome]|uniref:Uncharacterized protein n=1 Tax=marine sediment metagenome TaxID=412755 RepID=A0A0F9SA64_9ZZZZ
MKNKEIDNINRWLDEEYGHDLLGRAHYRIIWSVGELEKRKGTFQIFSGPIFLREFYGVQEQPKYRYHPDWRERWILERLDFSPNDELVLNQPGHYEPLYVFYDREGKYQKPFLRAIKYYMYMLTKPRPKLTDKQWQNRLAEEEKKEFDEETEFFYGCLEDEYGGGIASALHYGEAIVNPGVIFDADEKPHWFDRGKKDASNSSDSDSVPSKGRQAGAATT